MCCRRAEHTERFRNTSRSAFDRDGTRVASAFYRILGTRTWTGLIGRFHEILTKSTLWCMYLIATALFNFCKQRTFRFSFFRTKPLSKNIRVSIRRFPSNEHSPAERNLYSTLSHFHKYPVIVIVVSNNSSERYSWCVSRHESSSYNQWNYGSSKPWKCAIF